MVTLPSKRAAVQHRLCQGKSLGEPISSAPVRTSMSGTMLTKTMLAPPRTVKYIAASPSLALPKTSLNSTCREEKEKRALINHIAVCRSIKQCSILVLSMKYYSTVSNLTLYMAAVEADPTTSEMPITE